LVVEPKDVFPGLETVEGLEAHKRTVLRFMGGRGAMCVRVGDEIAGVPLFSRAGSMICFLAVSPKYRRKRVASALLKRELEELGPGREITVTTFRNGDYKGVAVRALYEKFNFRSCELTVEFDYPLQIFRPRP